jgi:hypothetical protein
MSWPLTVVAVLVWALQSGPAAQAGVVGEWLFNGDFTDSSTNDNHGVPSGGPVFVDTPRGMGISLDGIDDMVDFGSSLLYEFTEPGDPPLMQLKDMTLEAWVSIAPVGHGVFDPDTDVRKHKIFGKTANEASALYYNSILARKSGGFAMLFQGPDVHLTVGPLVVTVDSGNLQTNWLQAVIEEVRIYDEYLSAEQVQDLFDPINVVDADVGDQVATEFLSEAGTTYELESTTDLITSNNWSGTGATVEGTGANLALFDPAGYSTSKLYRVAIRL